MVYDVFISYSHSADGKLAPALQRALRTLAKPWYRLKSLSVFRDETNLSAASDLSNVIRAAVSSSRYFVYLASPDAAISKWVGEEIETWKKRGLPENFLIAVTEGEIEWDTNRQSFDWEKSTALHPNLKGIFKREPLWVDLRWARADGHLSPRDPRFQHATAMLAAPIHGKTLEELVSEDVHQYRNTRRLIGIVIGVLTLLLALSILTTKIATKANQNLLSELDMIESIFPFFDTQETTAEEVYDEEPFFRRLWFRIKGSLSWPMENPEQWIEWGPDRLAVFRDCSSHYNVKEESGVDFECPKLKSDFDEDGLRTDIVGLNAMVKTLVTSLNNGDLAEMLADKGIEGEFGKPEDKDTEYYRALSLLCAKVLLPDRLWNLVTTAAENNLLREPSLYHYFNIWRRPLDSAGRDTELILILLTDQGYCGSGGCENLMIGFLHLGEKYQLIIAKVSPGKVALYDAQRGKMPQILTLDMTQAGSHNQYRNITRYSFDSESYRPYLSGAIKAEDKTADERVPKEFGPVKR